MIVIVCSTKLRNNGNFFFSSRRRHTRFDCDWSSDVCSSDLGPSSATVSPSRTSRLTPSKTTLSRKRLEMLRSSIISRSAARSEEHTSELQSQSNLVCRLLLEKKKKQDMLHVSISKRETVVQ